MTHTEFAKRFLSVFSPNVTEKEFAESVLSAYGKNITKYQIKRSFRGYRKGYLWLGLSYKLLPCLEGDEARIEYDKVEKTDAFEIYYDDDFGDKETTSINEMHLTAKQIDDLGLAEFYIIGKDFSWCYVLTHAGDGCGPFFCYAPKSSEQDNSIRTALL